MKVETILKAKGSAVFTILTTATLASAVVELNTRNVGALVVTAPDGSVAGILSERDIVRRIDDAPAELLARLVSTAMTPKPFTCTPDDELDNILQLMTQKRIRHLPVVVEGALVGLISIGDVVKRKIELAEEEASALRDYIAS